jgi:hypothetical protein
MKKNKNYKPEYLSQCLREKAASQNLTSHLETYNSFSINMHVRAHTYLESHCMFGTLKNEKSKINQQTNRPSENNE